jgi:hypothetical protein
MKSLKRNPEERSNSSSLLKEKWILDHKQISLGHWMHEIFIPLKKKLIKEYRKSKELLKVEFDE